MTLALSALYQLGDDPPFERCLPDTEAQEGVAWAAGPLPARGAQ